MTPLAGVGTVFVLIAAFLVMALPRKWASVPLLVGTCYMTLSQGVQLGPFNFFAIRLLIAAGIVRAALREERPANGMNVMDGVMVIWSMWLLASSAFHKDPSANLTGNLGLIFNTLGIYFLLRAFCQSVDDVVRLCRIVSILLVPVAFEMVWEQFSSHNTFSLLGGVPESPDIRQGRLRSQGPFSHAILAGTVGAVCMPLAVGLWSQYRRTAMVGIAACSTMVIASASSGPVMSWLFAIVGLIMWPLRYRMRAVRWLLVLTYLGLELAMKVPAYYLIARVDVVGGSTGWHRAALIESAIAHLDEWWLGGTDYTRHWMPTGVSWSPDHTDITNHYIQMGVVGGLLSTTLFVATLAVGFSFVGRAIRQQPGSRQRQFFVWTLGASLFAHAATSISVSYFDQSFVFLYLTLAAIAVTYGASVPKRSVVKESLRARMSHRALG